MGTVAAASPSTETTFLAIGDVHGHWESVIQALEVAGAVLGRAPDAVLQVGDASPYRNESEMLMSHVPSKYRTMGTFAALRSGDLAAPVYFIGGNHEPYEALDQTEGPYPVPWGDNVYYLGRAGAASIENLNLAWLSGIEGGEMLPIRGTSKKERSYYLECEIEAAIEQGQALGGIDVLITHDWPSGIIDGVGKALIRVLIEELKPKLQVCGHMHTFYEATIGDTMVHALNAVPPAVRGRDRYGWWRLYSTGSDGSIRCIAVGS